jgi:hypothetical protein
MALTVVTAPEPLPARALFEAVPSVFVAGGISGCRDWQSEEFLPALERGSGSMPLLALNPRRLAYAESDETATAQIEWEFEAMRVATMVSFWFPPETLCPITLYELGRMLVLHPCVLVGAHPDYKRRLHVEVQTRLARRSVRVVYSLADLATQVLERAEWQILDRT